jgi:EAL domain-containing protein (putative c-di-GMP-specific phosphodiesterase class I)
MSDDALGHVPLTAVALDRALVGSAASQPARADALEDALEAIRKRGLPAVARGCDDAAAYELLLQVGCRHAQGEFIAGALPGGRLADWARDWIAPAIAESSP